jgi:allantoinase
LALRSERVVTPDGLRPSVVVVEGERIVAVRPHGERVDAPLEDLGALVIAPGLVDAHVHVNEPGHTEWEGFATATAAAAAGGTTTLVDMPLNSLPTTTTVAALHAKRDAARGQCRVDVGFYGGLVPGSADGELAALLAAGVLGVKTFLCPSGLPEFPPTTRVDLEAALPLLRESDVPLLVHAELMDEALAGGAQPDEGLADRRSYRAWAASRPVRWEERAVELLIGLSASSGARIHVVHLSSSPAVELLRAAHARDARVSAETCPHYLFFASEVAGVLGRSAEDVVPDGDPRFKCAPPIRSRCHREALWQGLRDGTITTIGSDHSPCPPPMKRLESGDLVAAWGGIASLQWTLPVVWSAARERGIALPRLTEWLARAPAALLGLERKGAIAAGRDADLVIWDPEARLVVEHAAMRDRHKLTPYAGRELFGRVERTYLRGRLVYAHGELEGAPSGHEVTRGGGSPNPDRS